MIRLAALTGATPPAQGAVVRSILVIIWHLLADPHAIYHDLGVDYYTTRIDKERRQRHLVQQLEALCLQVTLTPAAA
ncbi:hypothetical protein FHR83_007637 [Actinoplanes campanulatus]|uniref:Transposase n=1 Tax=Actinoplanes campanulatus TaxID=113559 RepID=A0A7W5APJ3_9ACTN|nr:hypothetical protein [Actinoplanes campanulatus]MBB3099921.1 hypothetical protein [Actinoplanes campanulatus]GGN48193.1 hypothetical protein GCM10010109_85160 [Actinoplanes campanulatus]GID40483.1 hypothetical protein Aca09nite_69890 [Actinoplanes campanulatus]